MSLATALLEEFEQQAPVTRRFLERLPGDQLAWRPHPKSMTAGQLALHLAQVPGGVAQAAMVDAFTASFSAPQPNSLAQIFADHDAGVATVRQLLPQLSDAALQASWRLLAVDGRELANMPRLYFIRNIMLNHWYQHRGQFSVYLRLLGQPVPSSWGPSADEPM